MIVNRGAPGLCGWPDPGLFACTALPMTASESVGKCCSQALTSKVSIRSLVVCWANEPPHCPLYHMVLDPALDDVIEVTECAFQK